MIRVLIADDHPVVRAAVEGLLRESDDLTVVGTAADGQEAVDLAMDVRPDVVLMDVSMPHLSGIEATRLLIADRPTVRVLMFSAEGNRNTVQAAREAGALGFLTKGCRGTEVLRAIRAVSAGLPVWPGKAQ